MPDSSLLSTEGIDALLDRFRSRRKEQQVLHTATASWTVDEPNVLGADAMAAMHLRHETVAGRISGDVSAVVRTHVHAKMDGLRQQRLRTVVDAMPERMCVTRFDVAELALPVFLILEPPTAMSIIDLLIGGKGDFDTITRELTRIEKRVLSDVFLPVVDAHRAGYVGIANLTMTMGAVYSSAQAMRAFPPTDLYLVADYAITVEEDLEWKMRFAMPLAELCDAMEASARIPVQTVELAADRRKQVERKLSSVNVGAQIVLGASELTLKDVTDLAPGDVVVLDRKTSQPFDMLVEGLPKYRGTLGRSGRSLAFRVSDVVERIEEPR